MTDLHCHILHDIDDGPADLDESLELCRIAWGNHIEHIVATPHFAEFREARDFLEKRDRRLEELKSALEQLEMGIDLYPGAEVLVSDEIFGANCLNRLTINQSRYLLVEFMYTGLSLDKLKRYLEAIQSRGLVPILAHPERYEYFQRDYNMLNYFLQNGFILQTNASSLYGNKAEHKLARELVRQKAVSILATDAHSVAYRPNNLLDMLNHLSSDIDFDYLDACVNRNPDIVLRNKVIDTGGSRHIQKRLSF